MATGCYAALLSLLNTASSSAKNHVSCGLRFAEGSLDDVLAWAGRKHRAGGEETYTQAFRSFHPKRGSSCSRPARLGSIWPVLHAGHVFVTLTLQYSDAVARVSSCMRIPQAYSMAVCLLTDNQFPESQTFDGWVEGWVWSDHNPSDNTNIQQPAAQL